MESVPPQVHVQDVYFPTTLKPLIKDKVNLPSRHGLVDSKWTSNNCEYINHVLKQCVDWKSKGLTVFAKLSEYLLNGRSSDLKAALIGTGEFRLSTNHYQFIVSKRVWLNMALAQRSILFKKYKNHKVNRSNLVTRTMGRTPGVRKRKVNVKTTTIIKRPKTDDKPQY